MIYDYTSKELVKESAKDIYDHILGFIPNKEQEKAIRERDQIKASRLGVDLDRYLYLISPRYKYKVLSLIHS
jgi:hypothetical protein